MTPRRPTAVAFDVVETLFSLAPVAEALRPLGVPLDLFFTRLLRDGFVLAAAGDHHSFPDLARSALAAVAPESSEQQREGVLGAFTRLPAHPDALPALREANDAGVTVAAPTNGSAPTTAGLLESAGLSDLVHRVLSVDEVGRWKPAPQPYHQMARVLGRTPDDVALVAVHSWDIHGALRAGLTTGWCSRLEGAYPSVFEPAHVTGADLHTVIRGLLALPT